MTVLVENKIAIVTGSGRGIGRAIALELAKQGADVAVSDINAESACAVAREIEVLGRRSLAVATDVADESQVQAMVRQCVEVFGKLDILVNNAGIVSTGTLTEISAEAWDRTMAVNLRSVFLCCKAVFPLMMAQRSGKIVNIASVAGKRGGGLLGNSCYAASKGGVIAFTKGIAREGGPYNINVNAITPALTETVMTSVLSDQQRESIVRAMPLGRAGKPEDIAAAVCFLASDSAAFITGEIMDVDGGLMMD
jgi:NAD(P)-dependent dehydrogenase (short-subunit alcohol dehydrogenase family)